MKAIRGSYSRREVRVLSWVDMGCRIIVGGLFDSSCCTLCRIVTYVFKSFPVFKGMRRRAAQFKPIIKSKETGENCRWNRKHVIWCTWIRGCTYHTKSATDIWTCYRKCQTTRRNFNHRTSYIDWKGVRRDAAAQWNRERSLKYFSKNLECWNVVFSLGFQEFCNTANGLLDFL